ncbi:hypothetical protein H4R18_001646 [Coemansia javaensis]|uniref:Secreted protein n=1 Tax=Coemansia javaensis TaxID=2761396 RepID=A0A9W8HEH9_9FUNG|nr:hypothetical protein H4R18_001646 [Coemansia javaensis]
MNVFALLAAAAALAVAVAAKPVKPVCDTCGITKEQMEPLRWLLDQKKLGVNVDGTMRLYIHYWQSYYDILDDSNARTEDKVIKVVTKDSGSAPYADTIKSLGKLLFKQNKCIDKFFYSNTGCTPAKDGK